MPKYRLNECIKCGEVPETKTSYVIKANLGRTLKMRYIKCPKCGRRTDEYTSVGAAAQAWNSGLYN